MSTTKLSQSVALKVWLRAGGRCEYRGCNEPLWQDILTLRQMNRAYLAHIIADEPGGPRGDHILSPQLANDPSNIMLLCDTHHRLVDTVDVTGHPVVLLQEHKKEHEERIELLIAIQPNMRTHILLFGSRIGDRQGAVNYEQARLAVLPERYPADEKGIRLDLTDNEIDEKDPEFWEQTAKYIDRSLGRYLDGNRGPTGIPINHLSVFALAPIPALIYFGKRLGDIVSAEVYQRQRSTKDWRWRTLDDACFDYKIVYPPSPTAAASRVALNLSLSDTVHAADIEAVLGQGIPTYTMTIAHPRRDFLRAKEQLELFQNEWHTLLASIRATYGQRYDIHLFAAVPNSIAVEIGRSLLPKSDPYVVVYDYHREHGGFRHALIV